MPDIKLVSSHYAQGGLLDAIRQGLSRIGKTEATVSLEDLGPVEEFHIGGRQASADFLDQLELSAADVVLDAGCGLGGAARFAASRYGSRIHGVDLTDEFVRTGQVMNEWVKLQDRITLVQGNATAIDCATATFDKAYMMHVGMNIADKPLLMDELFRVLKPGGRLGIFDVMQTGDSELTFPVPWASQASGSALAPLDVYESALEAAGFDILATRNRHDFALAFFAALQAANASAGGPPPLGLHLVMGADAAVKVANMVANVSAGRIAPIEIIAAKPG